jgi:hypothetical protein
VRCPWNSMEPVPIVRSHIVLYQSPIVVVRGLHDGILRAGSQGVSAQRCSSLLRACSFLFDHVDGDTQDDGGIEAAISISRTCVVAGADVPIRAKEASCVCLGMRDHRLF